MTDTNTQIRALLNTIESVGDSINWLEALKEKPEYKDTLEDINHLIDKLEDKKEHLSERLDTLCNEEIAIVEAAATAEG